MDRLDVAGQRPAGAEARRALFVSFREALRQGALAIAWDNVAFVGPWGFRLDDVTVPVHLWHGSEDQMVPRSHGEWLAAHLPHATLKIYEGEGHLLPLRHWDEMLRTLTSAA
ncbi:alpha/beta fold hydrolase [Dietzia sp. ANT_WB102]|uniref:alpha/beta fold hydrolase n=1 Tax=Dietzia sp. ANT_WB102 TaxID=2597345 RepID=UPI002106FD6A|nr:alpha/beta hydrolase [Dietzia sp. ANT_WB102]